MESRRFSLNRDDVKSICMNVLLVMVSAGITQLFTVVPNVNFGENSTFIIVVLTALLKTAQKFVSGVK